MDALETVTSSFDVDTILGVSVLPGGSADCYLVCTVSGSYVLKQTGRADFLQVINRMAQTMNEQGYRQARVIRTKSGCLLTAEGYALLEFIPGEVPDTLSDAQSGAVLQYLGGFNRALSTVAVASNELQNGSVWDKAKSLDFLCQELASSEGLKALDAAGASLLLRANAALCQQAARLERVPKQLVHSDLGPGNIVFQGPDVYSIIDFTPEYEHPLYSLAQFLYWTRFHPQGNTTSAGLRSALTIYYHGDEKLAGQDLNLLLLYLLKASLFRVVGPLLQMQEAGTVNPQRLHKRLAVLRTVLELQQPSRPVLR